MKKEIMILLSIVITSYIIIGCGVKNENKGSEEKVSESLDVFYNSRKNTYFKAITIKKTDDDIIVIVHYTDKENCYVGEEADNEIIVELENGNKLHLYKNGERELRVYKIVQDGYQPEDIEWTFYKNMNDEQL